MMSWSTVLVLSLLVACGGSERGGEGGSGGSAHARGALVAKVDGAAIGVEQVRELCASTGLPPREALLRLEEEQLLLAEAARRGYGRAPATDQALKRALVQALLLATVESMRAEDVPSAEVQERFDSVAKHSGLPPETFPEHERAVRAQLLLEKRRAAVEQLAARLHDQIGVKLSEPEVQKLLNDPAFWGESS
jgi:hypothetical protein